MTICISTVALAQKGETKKQWNAGELWSQSTSEGLQLLRDGIQLDGNLLIESDADKIGSIRADAWDTISAGTILRKRLALPALPVKNAIVAMMVYPAQPMNGGKLVLTVNGHDPVIYEVRHFWTTISIPAGYFKLGENLIEVTAQDNDTKFRMSRSVDHRHDSAFTTGQAVATASEKSIDGGKTWSFCQGEYPIRLRLDSFYQHGSLQTPVINLSDPAIAGVLLKPTIIEAVKFTLAMTHAEESKKTIRIRSGNTHQPEAGGWTGWQLLDRDILPAGFAHRFIQFEFSFEMNSTTASPRITGFSVESRWQFSPPETSDEIVLTEAVNKPIIRHSLSFQYEDPLLPALQEFRKKFQLDKVVEGAPDEWGKIKKLRSWVAGLWDWYLPDPELPDMINWDAREILSPITREGRTRTIGGYCLQYAIVFAQACQSFGIPSRIVTLNYSIWGGHEVTEVWSRDLEKWVMMDAQFDAMFTDRQTGRPCSALELHQIFLETYYPGNEIIDRDEWTITDRNRRSENIDPAVLPIAIELGGHAHSGKLKENYVWWKAATDTDAPGYSGGYGFFNAAELRWLPRSNWLSQPDPMPVTHGRTHWGWDGYLCWTDHQTPETPEHRYFVSRPADMYGRLFTVDISAEPAGKGVLRIAMATEGPGFKYFEINQNGHKQLSSQAIYLWKLAGGKNTIEIRTVDSLGNLGGPSKLSIDYRPQGKQIRSDERSNQGNHE